MLKNLAKILMAMSMGLASAAHAKPSIKDTAGELAIRQAIEVIAVDGERYNEIKSSTVEFYGRVYIKPKNLGRYHTIGYNIRIGTCTGEQCLTTAFPPIAIGRSDDLGPQNPGSEENLDVNISENIDPRDFPGASGNPLTHNGQAAKIIKACNDLLTSEDSIYNQHETSVSLNVTVELVMRHEREYSKNYVLQDRRMVAADVICTQIGDPTSDVQAPPKPYSVEVTPGFQQGQTCPKEFEVKAVIKYRQPATARFRFRVDGKLSGLRTIEARKLDRKRNPSLLPGRDTYVVEATKTYRLDPGQHTFSVEVRGGKKSITKARAVDCPPFKVTEAWLNYKVQDTPVCPKNVREVATFKATRPGQAPFAIKTQGGLVVNSGTAIFKRKGREYVATIKRKTQMSAFESLMIADIPAFTSASGTGQAFLKVDCLELSGGDFSFIDNTGTQCPREGKALINFSMNIRENIPYRFDCSNGNFSGVAQAVPDNNGGFVAPALVKFNIANTTQANCALKSVVAGQTKTHKVKGHLFKCITPTFDPGSNDLTVEPTPPAGASDTNTGGRIVEPLPPPSPPPGSGPGKIVDPVRTVSCTNGIVRYRSCLCPRTHKKVKTGPNAWRCDRQMVVDPAPTGGQTGVPGASPDTKPVSGQPTRANPTTTGGQPTRGNPTTTSGQPTRANPDADKRRLEELKKKQAEQKRAAEYAAKRKAAVAAAAAAKKKAAAAKKKAAAAAKKKAAAAKKKAVAAKKKAVAAKKKAAAAKKKAAAAKKKAAAAAKKKAAAAAAARKKAAAAAAARKKAAAAAKKKAGGFVAQ